MGVLGAIAKHLDTIIGYIYLYFENPYYKKKISEMYIYISIYINEDTNMFIT